MDNTTIAIASVTFLLVITGLFGYTYYQRIQLEDASMEEPVTEAENPAPEGRLGYIESIDAKHFFIDGAHTLVGELDLPTPCDLLEHNVVVAESFPEQIQVNFTVLNNAQTCAQVITTQRFMVEVTASEQATFNARLEGRSVRLNLIPAAEGETPDEFELFYKG